MTVATRCPDPKVLQDLLLGRLAPTAAERLERHVEQCARCARLLPSLPAEDSLVAAMRAPARATLAPSDLTTIQDLIPRLRRLQPAIALAKPHPGEAPRMNANTDAPAFLNPPQAPGEIGRLGPYRVLKRLGQGGMGMVFLAEDPQLQRTVALKVMLPEAAKKPVARQRFLREARATAKLEHDHIVTIYQVGEDRGVPYLAMQLLKGMSLDEYLKRKNGKTGTPMSVGQILKLGLEIARGLAAAHEQGLIHRDIKPANIWLDATAGGRVKILDFGLARAVDGDGQQTQLTQLGTIVGTAAYMAPEQAASGKVDGRTDLFSLGCVLYRLAAGRLPWMGGDVMETLVAIASEPPKPVAEWNPNLPPKLAQLIMKLIAKAPEQRPASAKKVVEAIQSIERDQPTMQMPLALPVATPVTTAVTHDPTQATGMLVRPGMSPSLHRPRRWLGVAIAGMAALFLAVAATVIYVQTDTGTLKIETKDPDVEVLVERNGNLIKVRAQKDGTTVTLDSGDYKLRLVDGKGNVKLSKNQVHITRGGKEVVTITRVDKVADLRPKEPPPTTKIKDPIKKPTEPPIQTKVKEPPTNPKPTKRVDDPPQPQEPPPSDIKYFTNSIGMKFAPIKPGEFMMGSTPEEVQRFKLPEYCRNEGPAHRVKITKPFLMGAHPVTLGQFFQFVRATDYKPKFMTDKLRVPYKQTHDFPVVLVTWHDAAAFCDWLSKKEGRKYRLPTEAEWEYACRAGRQSAFSFGDDASLLGRYGWYRENSANQAHPVGQLASNRWGLYDMHGNVYQWTADWYAPDYYKNSPAEDPPGAAENIPPGAKSGAKVMRGGEHSYEAWACRSAARKERPPDYATPRTGFRIALEK